MLTRKKIICSICVIIMVIFVAGCIGAQRSDPKSGDPDDYRNDAPQGDSIRIYNYVRPVRG